MNWSGYAYDEQHSLLVVNTNNLPAKIRLVPADKFEDESNRSAEDAMRLQHPAVRCAPYGIFLHLPVRQGASLAVRASALGNACGSGYDYGYDSLAGSAGFAGSE